MLGTQHNAWSKQVTEKRGSQSQILIANSRAGNKVLLGNVPHRFQGVNTNLQGQVTKYCPMSSLSEGPGFGPRLMLPPPQMGVLVTSPDKSRVAYLESC